MLYDVLLDEAASQGLIVVERNFRSDAKGLIKRNKIGIRRSLNTVEKGCVLAEELGHHFTGAGDIINPKPLNNIRQELRARQWGYVRVIPFVRFVEAHKARISGRYELAAFFGITEQTLQEAADRYKDKHGLFVSIEGKYTLCLDPLCVIE